ncbi:MAG: hypothetical protein IK955_02160 [Clostridia bacterium]|nr:hypothetical protein [Clostridia bacterium]
MVKNSCHAHKKLGQFFKRCNVEALTVAVNLVVAKDNIEGVNILCRKLLDGQIVDKLKFISRDRAGRNT